MVSNVSNSLKIASLELIFTKGRRMRFFFFPGPEDVVDECGLAVEDRPAELAVEVVFARRPGLEPRPEGISTRRAGELQSARSRLF